jgi:hypothetical protein
MSFPQRVQDALTREGVPITGASRDGYRVEKGLDGTVLVRWGFGSPFKPLADVSSARNGPGLARCIRAISTEFKVGRGERADEKGLYILVSER